MPSAPRKPAGRCFSTPTRSPSRWAGHFLEQSYQEWNANGQVDDCGSPGFGFNGGNWAQDFCIDNVWIEESSIDPDTPLPAVPMDQALRCESVLPLS
jgi:hypothetical protein